MNNEESLKVLKSNNDPKLLLELFESTLGNFKGAQKNFNLAFVQEILDQLAFTCVSLQKISLKSSIESTVRSLQKIINSHQNVTLNKEMVQFFSNIGKSLKRLTEFDLAEKYFHKGSEIGEKTRILEPILVEVYIDLCKLITKKKKYEEALLSSIKAANLCQEIVLNSKAFSSEKLAVLTCKTYYQVAIQEELLQNYDQSLLWCRKAERILIQNPDALSKFSGKIEKTMGNLELKTSKIKGKNMPTVKTSRNFSDFIEEKAPSKTQKFPSSVKSNFNLPISKFRTVRNPDIYFKSKTSSRKKINAEKITVDNNEVNRVDEHFSPISKVNDTSFNSESEKKVIKKVISLNVACQTDIIEKVEKSTTIEGLKYNEKDDRLYHLTFGKALVKNSKIDIRQEEYEIKYYLNSDFTKVLIIISNTLVIFDKEIAFDTELPVLDLIFQKLHPRIDLENNEIIFREETYKTLFEGTILKESKKVNLKLQEKSPRGEIIVTFTQDNLINSKSFRISEISPGVQNFLKTPEFLLMCFDINGEYIKMNPPTTHKLELLYYKRHDFSNFPQTHIKVSKIPYKHQTRYLFQAIYTTNFYALIIEDNLLSQISRVPLDLLDLHIEKISELVTFKDSGIDIKQGEIAIVYSSQNTSPSKLKNEEKVENYEDKSINEVVTKVQSYYRGFFTRKTIQKDLTYFSQVTLDDNYSFDLTFTDSTLNKKLKIEAIGSRKVHYLVLKYPIPFKQPFKESIPNQLKLKNNELFLKKPDTPNGYIFRDTLEQAEKYEGTETYIGFGDDELIKSRIPSEIYNKIIYRTSLKKDNVMYQINMELHKSETGEDILEFNVRSGPMAENSHKFVIDLKTICLKSKLACTQLEFIGKYVVQNMITFAGKTPSFINFDERHSRSEVCIIRLQAFFRGLLARKQVKLTPLKVIFKSYHMYLGRKWLCLFKSDKINVFLYLVASTDTISLKLNIVKITNENPYASLKTFLKNKLIPKLRIELENGKVEVSGIEEYLVVS